MDPKQVVGEFFEKYVKRRFNLTKTSKKELPDLISKEYPFYVEVKASQHGNVIKEKQLKRFDTEIDARRFYALCYHPLKDLKKNYQDECSLFSALYNCKRSIYMFPFSIVKAHFETGKKQDYGKNDRFVHFRKNQASDIFDEDMETWKELGLKSGDYRCSYKHPQVFLITRKNDCALEAMVRNSYTPGKI
jgi:hypothetical protein